jgi:hypothetical protein
MKSELQSPEIWGRILVTVTGDVLFCEWCRAEFTRPHEKGPAPKYCCRAHRQRAHEHRYRILQRELDYSKISGMSALSEAMSGATASAAYKALEGMNASAVSQISAMTEALAGASMSPVVKALDGIDFSKISGMSALSEAMSGATASAAYKALEGMNASAVSQISAMTEALAGASMSPVVKALDGIDFSDGWPVSTELYDLIAQFLEATDPSLQLRSGMSESVEMPGFESEVVLENAVAGQVLFLYWVLCIAIVLGWTSLLEGISESLRLSLQLLTEANDVNAQVPELGGLLTFMGMFSLVVGVTRQVRKLVPPRSQDDAGDAGTDLS